MINSIIDYYISIGIEIAKANFVASLVFNILKATFGTLTFQKNLFWGYNQIIAI